jgi:RNA polymerase sigma-70 factor (ECF subfamily)
VRSFLDGDREAFGSLVERHERRVYNLAYRMLGNAEDARDTAQDVFVTCLRKLSGFRGTSTFTTWVHRVTVNACYDALRKRSREQPVAGEEGTLPEPRETAPDPADEASFSVDVQRALLGVPEEFRAVLVMHDVQGIPYEEIAEALGAPVGTVKSRLHRGRVALARLLGPGPGEHPEGSDPSNQEVTRG